MAQVAEDDDDSSEQCLDDVQVVRQGVDEDGQHDEWAVSRRYICTQALAAAAKRSLRLEPSEEQGEDLDCDAVSPLLEAAVA